MWKYQRNRKDYKGCSYWSAFLKMFRSYQTDGHQSILDGALYSVFEMTCVENVKIKVSDKSKIFD